MFIALLTIATFLTGFAFGRWQYPSEVAVVRKREEKERALERPDYERARQLAEIQSEVSKCKGWFCGWVGFRARRGLKTIFT